TWSALRRHVLANSFKTSASDRLCVALEFLSVQRSHTIAARCRRVAPSTASVAAATAQIADVRFTPESGDSAVNGDKS
ncbi:MAG: hypothetical protein WBD83_26815, partial [Xanthobacteraceae bacterium]